MGEEQKPSLSSLTEQTPLTWSQSVHYNMGARGYGYGFRCQDFPRLTVIERSFRPTREEPDGKFTRTWCVDGLEVPSFEAAVEKLKVPPFITDDEQRVLELVPFEFTDARQLESDLSGTDNESGATRLESARGRVTLWLMALHAKGLVEYGRSEEDRVTIRRCH